MNKEQAKDAWPLIKAFSDGKTIQMNVASVNNGVEKWNNVDRLLIFDDVDDLRIKPATRMIGSIECPMPLSNLNDVIDLYLADIKAEEKYLLIAGNCHPLADRMLKRGLCFATKEDAIQTSKAILKLLEVK